MTTTTETTATATAMEAAKKTKLRRALVAFGRGTTASFLPLYLIGCAAMGYLSASYGLPTPAFDTTEIRQLASAPFTSESEGSND